MQGFGVDEKIQGLYDERAEGINSLVTHGSPETEEKPDKPEKDHLETHLRRMDKIFNELLDDVVPNSPEAKRATIEIAVNDLYAVAENMAHLRNIEAMQEMKEAMLENWRRLQELTNGDPEQLRRINEWGKRFNESKVIEMEGLANAQERLTEVAGNITSEQVEARFYMASIIGRIPNEVTRSQLQHMVDETLNPKKLSLSDLDIDQEVGVFTKARKDPVGKFVDSITDLDQINRGIGLNSKEANEFMAGMDRVFGKLVAEASGSGSAEAMEDAKTLKESIKALRGGLLEANLTYGAVVKLRELSMLPVLAF